MSTTEAPPTMAEFDEAINNLVDAVVDEDENREADATVILSALFARAIERANAAEDCVVMITKDVAHICGEKPGAPMFVPEMVARTVNTLREYASKVECERDDFRERAEKAEARNTEEWNLASDLNKDLRERAERAEALLREIADGFNPKGEAEPDGAYWLGHSLAIRIVDVARGLPDPAATIYTALIADNRRLQAELALIRERIEATGANNAMLNRDNVGLSAELAKVTAERDAARKPRSNDDEYVLFMEGAQNKLTVERDTLRAERAALREDRDRLRAALANVMAQHPHTARCICGSCAIARVALAFPAQEAK